MAEGLVLDTSACFALLENETGAEAVEAHLLDARAGRLAIHAAFVTLTEVEYIITQERGAEDAESALSKMKAWPIQWHHSDDALCSAAAKLKAAHRISLADSFVAALAQQLDATLIHKDPEFNTLESVVKLTMLPPKGVA
ncbi:MAG: PIN domain-containing protein [Verrucomicrobia bacterium]|nr:PIN domain-containing protein [Verrucomicrobiota bacterium]